MVIKISPNLEEIVRDQVKKMLENNIFMESLPEQFGGLSLFINKKPKIFVLSLKIDSHQVWIGAEEIKKSK